MSLRRAAIILCLLAVHLSAVAAHAQHTGATATWRGVWNGVDLTVFVVARGHALPEDVKHSEPWWRWGNTTTDAYLFSWSKDNLVDLILDFSLEEGHPKATLYAPVTSEQRLNIQIHEGAYTLPEGLWPSLALWPREGNWLVDGQANFNLEGQQMDPLSGIPAWKLSVGGDQPGLPQWDMRTLLNDPHPGDGHPRFTAKMREDETVPYELATPLMPSWPYLSAVFRELHYGKTQPVFFDLENRRIESDIWAGFHTAGMYQINSLSYPPETDFETPFAFYRFDPEAGRYPNLVIRADIWPASSPFGPPIPQTQRTAVRMTWTEKTPDFWRYSLSAIGNHPMDEQVVMGDTVIHSVAYWELPSWITSKPWKAVTFVEATQGEYGSEGIYHYSVEDNYPVSFWVNGPRDEPPDTFHAPYLRHPVYVNPEALKEGFRGEYSLVYNRTPQLYFSSLDNRVHLRYAEGGVWNLGNQLVLRMHNLDAGPYINGWTRERVPETSAPNSPESLRAWPGEVEEALYALTGYLIYSGAEGAELRRAAYQQSNFALRPPVDKSTWQLFNEQLAPFTAQQRDPNNLKNWLSHFPGPALKIRGGYISEVRAIANGFRFVLDLEPGYGVQENDLLDVPAFEPGPYVVTYNGQFTVAPLTPPAISALLIDTTLTQLEPGAIRVALRNDGLEDLPQATLELWATSPDRTTDVVVTQTVQLLAQEPITPTLLWAPASSGTWSLTPKVRQPDGRLISGEPMSISISPPQTENPYNLFFGGVSLRRLPMILGGLITLATLVALVFWYTWREPLTEK